MSVPLAAADALRVEAYTPAQAAVWDALVAASTNGPFLFARTFLDYHQDRFIDHSWLVWQGPKLRAVFAAAVARTTTELTTLVAHPGLAYGGLVTAAGVKYAEAAAMLDLLRAAWQAAGFQHLLVRPVPRVFCRQFSENQVFWLHQQGAVLSNRELNSVLDLTEPVRIGTWRRGNLRKARLHGVAVRLASNADYEPYWQLLTETLAEVHGRQPVHTLTEISRLRDQNPGHLELWGAWLGTELVAGVVVFQDKRQGFAHTQYIAGNSQGKQVGAVDAVLAHLIKEKATQYRRLSFGISTVQGVVNPGLLNQKEGFGATAELMDAYRLAL
ncbi:GNAT family N-acetyltransferase [Hymenobacter sp. BT186]|uniref:GNAT family N-acetyltransferase n=1 Tax=Hymenobacter telluris TaxID=2816474 RepID=A0A939JG37_9BACT|nr:GNAT family N-acetyltransferase [Hymenobacter telluris]MBO0361077.1 GNAT family N-acetyltransferase [Hymenobacter telluris]MBW3377105.1 GNAT family N-acetyltransferase [Hymenobacter norwichensis]